MWLVHDTSPTLSVCVITQNQAKLLGPLLRQAASVADEIVIVDGGSHDHTRALCAAAPKVRLFERAFDNFAQQKNFAIEQARCDWVLFLDSDELLGDRLVKAIPSLIRWRWRQWYKLPRYWLIATAPPQHVVSERLYPDWQLRLFRNAPRFRYVSERPLHEHFPRRGRGFGKKVSGTHIVHLDFLVNDRVAREQKVARYNAADPNCLDTNNMYLYEDHPHEVVACEEPISALRALEF